MSAPASDQPMTVRRRIRARLMRNATATFVSLVDRPATRSPFKAIKREFPIAPPPPTPHIPEPFPMLNFTTVKRTETRPGTSAPTFGMPRGALMAVVARGTAHAPTGERLRAAGLLSEGEVLKAENGSEAVIFRQADFEAGAEHVGFRLDDDTIALVSGVEVKRRMSLYNESTVFSDVISTDGFFPSIHAATEALHHVIRSGVYAGDDGETTIDRAGHRDIVAKALSDYQSYVVDAFDALPESVFKLLGPQSVAMGEAIGKIVKGDQSIAVKIVQRPPEQDDGDSKIDHSIAPNQQVAAAAAAEKEKNPAQKQRAYNLAVANTPPEWPDDMEQGRLIDHTKDPRKDDARPTAQSRETMHDTGREVSNDENRGHPSNFTRSGEFDDREDSTDTGGPGTGKGGEGGAKSGKTGTGQDGPDGATETELESQKGPGEKNLPDPKAREAANAIDPGPLGEVKDGGAQTTEPGENYGPSEGSKLPVDQQGAASTEQGIGAAAHAQQYGTDPDRADSHTGAAAEGDAAPADTAADAGKTEAKKSEGEQDLAAMLAGAVTAALAPVVTRLDGLAGRMDTIEETSATAVAKADRLSGTVLGADREEDPLSTYAMTTKSADPWAGVLDVDVPVRPRH